MMNKIYYLAIDIGASSGRHIVGYQDDEGHVKMDEVHRFANNVQQLSGDLVWDLENLFNQVKIGIKKALKKYQRIKSMSIDTWGVDYVLFDNMKECLPCYSYRSTRTKRAVEDVHKLIDFSDLYKITGTQFQPFNTIYQLYEDKLSGRLNNNSSFLMMAEYLIYRLTDIKVHEYTNASTTGLLNLKTNTYSKEIIDKLEFPPSLFSKLVKPGHYVGPLRCSVQDEVGGNIDVVLCATHDTASAVEAIPFEQNEPYLSSGTWSLLGIKVNKGINSEQAQLANFTNEYGPNYIRFQKNIMGLWIIQRLAQEMKLTFEEISSKSKLSAFTSVYDVNDPAFIYPKNMKQAIIDYYKNHGLPLPSTDSDILNATFYSLAHSYKQALEQLEVLTNKKYQTLYIVGGGAHNDYLNELTAKITKKRIIVLAIEATAYGNLKIQMEENHD